MASTLTQTPPPREKWLILSHGFNMDGRAASQTITDKMPFLLEHGIDPVVLSAITGTRDSRFRHMQILPWGGAGLRFDLRHLLRRHIGQGVLYRLTMFLLSLVLAPFILLEKILLGLQSQWSWSLPATLRSLLVIRRERPRVLYTTGGAYSAHLAGYWLKRLTGISWIAEIHDPMVTPGRTPSTRDQRFMARLEGKICRHADMVWWFTEGALSSARARHPELGERGHCLLPGATPPMVTTAYQPGEKLVFAHFGSISDSRSLAPFFNALSNFLAKHPAARQKLQVEVYGGELDRDSRDAVQQRGLQDIVRGFGRLEYSPETGLSGRERVVIRMQEADCLLLLHGAIPECSEYIPSKLYEYFWARRPILALTHRNPQMDQMILDHGGLVAPTLDEAAIEACITRTFDAWTAGESKHGIGKPIGVAETVEAIVNTTRSFGRN